MPDGKFTSRESEARFPPPAGCNQETTTIDEEIDPATADAETLRRILARTLGALAEAHRRIIVQNAEIERLRMLSITDPTTGLLNRRGFVDALRRALDRAQRYGETGALLIIDLDGFKAINDTYGHAAGDCVLATVARILCFNVRASDEAARLGGDEFAILMTRTGATEAAKRAAALDRLLNQLVVPWQGRAIQVQGSIGVQTYGPDDTAAVLFQRADEKMYRRKEQRRAPGEEIGGRPRG